MSPTQLGQLYLSNMTWCVYRILPLSLPTACQPKPASYDVPSSAHRMALTDALQRRRHRNEVNQMLVLLVLEVLCKQLPACSSTIGRDLYHCQRSAWGQSYLRAVTALNSVRFVVTHEILRSARILQDCSLAIRCWLLTNCHVFEESKYRWKRSVTAIGHFFVFPIANVGIGKFY